MRLLALLSALVVSTCAFADSIDLGQASSYNAFVKQNYTVQSSDVEGRVAVGGNLNINGGYDIGTHILDYGMGTGPSLVVGGDINKTGTGNFNVYQSSTTVPRAMGDIVMGGTINGGPNGTGTVTENSNNLPVDFDSAFAHLEDLSNNLQARTKTGDVTLGGSSLHFTVDPNVVPENNVYVFNVTEDMFDKKWDSSKRTDWFLNTEGMAEGSTVVFNVSNTNGSTVTLPQANLFLTSNSNPTDHTNPMSGYFAGKGQGAEPPIQVLYNFAGASQLNLNSDLYGTVLAPKADIIANSSVIWGQVIGKSWEGNMQINYNPFEPINNGGTPVPEAPAILLFVLALSILLIKQVKRKPLSQHSDQRVALA